MEEQVVDKVKAYVLEHYPKQFKDKPILITEGRCLLLHYNWTR